MRAFIGTVDRSGLLVLIAEDPHGFKRRTRRLSIQIKPASSTRAVRGRRRFLRDLRKMGKNGSVRDRYLRSRPGRMGTGLSGRHRRLTLATASADAPGAGGSTSGPGPRRSTPSRPGPPAGGRGGPNPYPGHVGLEHRRGNRLQERAEVVLIRQAVLHPEIGEGASRRSGICPRLWRTRGSRYHLAKCPSPLCRRILLLS